MDDVLTPRSTDARGSATGGRVVVVGSINVDLFARVSRHPRPGETVLGGDGSTRPGGKGANQAVAAALAGADTVMVGAVGDDAPAGVGVSLLRRAGVDLDRVRTVPGTPTGLALITVSDAGENSIIVIPGANHSVALSDVDRLDLTAVDVLVVQGELPVDVVDAAVAAAAAAGARAVVNLAPVVDLSTDTLRTADPLVVNEHEAFAAASRLGLGDAVDDAETDDAETDDAEAEEDAHLTVEAAGDLAGRIVGAGVASVVITLGGDGVVFVDSAGAAPASCPGRPVQVVDTTGAGDCFVGTLAAHLARGASMSDAVAAGNEAAAHAVQGHGAQESYGWEARA